MDHVAQVIEVTGDSQHAVAYALLLGIAVAEGLTISPAGLVQGDAEKVLRAYAACVRAVVTPADINTILKKLRTPTADT